MTRAPLHHENSWNSWSKQHSLFPPPLDRETRGNRWTEGVRTVKMECGGNCRRVLSKTRGQAGSRTCRSEILIQPDSGRGIFPTIGMLDTRITQIEILVSPTDICRICIHIDRGDRWWRRIRVSRQNIGFILRVDFLEFLLQFL